MLLVGVLGPNGPCQEVAVRHVSSGVYSVVYRPDEVGAFTVAVKYNDRHIPGSPFSVIVD
jgi:filamin